MPQSIYRYREYLLGLERRNGLLLITFLRQRQTFQSSVATFLKPPRILKPKHWQKLSAA